MSFPDRIERVVEVRRPPEDVWSAISTAEGLGSWFSDTATIELRPGGALRLTWDDGSTEELRVERVEPPRLLALTWPVEGMPSTDPRRTHVEFTLEPTATGTRVRVVETGFAQLPDEVGRARHDSHSEGWTRELGELAGHLHAD